MAKVLEEAFVRLHGQCGRCGWARDMHASGPDGQWTVCPENQLCHVCQRLVRVIIYKGSGVCSQNCERKRDAEHRP